MLGVDLGEEQLRETAEGFGFEQRLEIPLSVTPSSPGSDMDDAQVATTSIGQYETRVSPLQMAMVAGAFAHDGVVMEPQLVHSGRTNDISTIAELTTEELPAPLPASH